MSAAALLSRVECVRQTGPNRWIARCPAHEDRSPSLAIREIEDGRVLIHCFASCGVESVLGAVGMTFSDLFPPRPIGHARSIRQPFVSADVLRCIGFEALVVFVAASRLASGEALSAESRQRLTVSCGRIQRAISECGYEK